MVDPIQPEYHQRMNELAHVIDEWLNGPKQPGVKSELGFILLVPSIDGDNITLPLGQSVCCRWPSTNNAKGAIVRRLDINFHHWTVSSSICPLNPP